MDNSETELKPVRAIQPDTPPTEEDSLVKDTEEPQTPKRKKSVGFKLVQQVELEEDPGGLHHIEEDEDGQTSLLDRPRRESLFKHALRRGSGVSLEEPRRFSINSRRRGSFGDGVLGKKEPEPRRRSMVVQELLRRQSSVISDVIPEEEEGEARPRRLSSPKIIWPKGVEEEVDVEKGEEGPARAAWGNKIEFLLTCVGYAVGLGNVWRFPYLCYKNGGGAFLIPYIIMLILVGLPLFFLELSFGQFASLGPITIWKINPLLKGLGYGMVIMSWLISLYYCVIIAHTLLFLFASMTSVLPWTTCDNHWNTPACLMPASSHNNTLNGTMFNTTNPLLNATDLLNVTAAGNMTSNLTGTKTPSEEYYNNYVLEMSSGIDEFGMPSWKLTLCLLLAWGIVLICLLKGIQSLGKVVYFTAIFPYVMLTVLLIRGVTLPGAIQGIMFYVNPDFSRLGDSRVWGDAATQIFYSLGTCSGGLIAMASYNKFDSNCMRDALIVATINCGTSIFGGFVIFSVLGFMAYEKGVDVADVASGGPGLAFVVYPEAISRMPVAPLWSILFFIMMATLGFGTQFSQMECVLSALTDEFQSYIHGPKESIILRSTVIGISFLLGIPMVCKGGIYLLNLVDYSVSGFPLLFIAVFELLAIAWIYGYKRFSDDIKMMLGKQPSIFWKACWMVVSPLIILVTIFFNIALYKEPELDGYTYPQWAKGIGWLTALFPIMVIPGWYIYKFMKDGGLDLLREANQPDITWGPALPEDRTDNYAHDGKSDGDDGDDDKTSKGSTQEEKNKVFIFEKIKQPKKGSMKKQSSFNDDNEGPAVYQVLA